MRDEPVKIWVTKWALTQGIIETEGVVVGKMAKVVGGGMFSQCVHGRDWHTSRDSAVKRACEMKEDRIVSLKKSLRKVESLTFE